MIAEFSGQFNCRDPRNQILFGRTASGRYDFPIPSGDVPY